jgi:hypothetical protein
MSILLLFYYWLHVSASKGHHPANMYTKLKNAGAYGIKVYFLFYLLLYFLKIDFFTKCTNIFNFFVSIGLMMAFRGRN